MSFLNFHSSLEVQQRTLVEFAKSSLANTINKFGRYWKVMVNPEREFLFHTYFIWLNIPDCHVPTNLLKYPFNVYSLIVSLAAITASAVAPPPPPSSPPPPPSLMLGTEPRGRCTLNRLYHNYLLGAFDIHAMHEPHSRSVSPIGYLPLRLSPRW